MSSSVVLVIAATMFLAPGVFSPNYKLTIGVDFALKSLTVSRSKKINLQLWYAGWRVCVCVSAYVSVCVCVCECL